MVKRLTQKAKRRLHSLLMSAAQGYVGALGATAAAWTMLAIYKLGLWLLSAHAHGAWGL